MANLDVSRSQRLDQKVVELHPLLSRAYAAKLIESGKVEVNGGQQLKPGYKLRPGDEVLVDYMESEESAAPDITLPVVYEDDDCVVISKPTGLLTHSKGAFNPEATVATWLRARVKDMEGSRAGIVHRLDRATSGVMICAKTPEALGWLQKQFSQRKVKKIYVAVVKGRISPEHALIDMPIERNPKAPATFRVGPQGKAARTTYRVLQSGERYSLIELAPETGRTHQLRVHLAHLGHPIVGDGLYDGEPADRLYLHAAELELTVLSGHERKIFRVELPEEFNAKVVS